MTEDNKQQAVPEASEDAAAEEALAHIRHDLRTPINQILGYSELLQEEAEDEGHEGYVSDLKKIQTAARRMLGMVNEVFSTRSMLITLKDRAAGEEPAPAVAGPATDFSADEGEGEGEVTVSGVETGSLLVVDDDAMNRDMLSRRLQTQGYQVTVAADGQEAIDRTAAGSFDCVLLDVLMPGLSGIDVLRIVRKTRSVADLPIVMATGLDASQTVVEALKLGANDYVTKPFDFPVVFARVRLQLALKRAKEQVDLLARELEKKNKFIRETFGRYLSEEIVASLLETPEGLKLGGEKRRVTIMMTDLRGFTSLAERLPPETVVKMLNNYLGLMSEVITKYRGTIDEFIGDAILVIFGAPITRDDDEERALACAIEMQLTMERVNADNEREGLPKIEMGIAINTGEVVVGNIGSQTRAKYGVVGSPVNLTARIESYTVGGQILIAEETYKRASGVAIVGKTVAVTAKGMKAPLTAYDLRGVGGKYDLALPEVIDNLIHLKEEIPFRFWVLDGKQISETANEGHFIRLSMTSGEVRAGMSIKELTNIKLRIPNLAGEEIESDVYAKVYGTAGDPRASFALRFTSIPPEAAHALPDLLGIGTSDQIV